MRGAACVCVRVLGVAESPEVVAVVGGGISAAQVALRLVGEGQEVHRSRATPCGNISSTATRGGQPKYMKGFERERSVDRRRVDQRGSASRLRTP